MAAQDRERKREHSKRYYAANREALIAANAERQRQARIAHPEKFRARAAVNNAIQRGLLDRQPCEVDGCGGKAEAHHEDYAKPLDVTWLCRRHHLERHKQRGDLLRL